MNKTLASHLRRCLIPVLTAVLLICSAGPSFAGDVEYLKQEPSRGVKGIKYELLDTKDRTYVWSFPYTDSFFREASSQFSMKLAQGSLGLACSTFRSSTGIVGPQYETYLKEAGFTGLYAFGYDEPTTEDSLSGVIGMKKIDDFTVIAAVTCGQGYGMEWAGNLKVGDSVRHEGFDTAARTLEGYIEQYIKDNGIEQKKKLWLTGMSRAAAIGNITAADMIESGEFDDVYAYLFGVPRTTKEPVAYTGIYNICGQYDPVAATPFQSWGYERYGIDLYTPAQESDARYLDYELGAASVGDKLADEGFRNNPEVNYQLRLFMETLDELFDSSTEYAERLQPLIIRAMKEKSENGDVTTVLSEALSGLIPKDSREATERAAMIDYLSFVVAQHMRADQRQINYGNWDPDEALEANLVIEHRPSTYIKWLFSTDDAQKLFSVCSESRRVTVIGDVDVDVYRAGMGIIGIKSKGWLYVPEDGLTAPREEYGGIFAMRNGRETVISLPADADYDLTINVNKDCSVTIYDILVSAGKLRSEPGRLYTGDAHTGQYSVHVKAGGSPDVPAEIGEGHHHTHFINTRFNYSPTVVMRNELDATKNSYMSISAAMHVVSLIMTGSIVLLIACLIIHRIHKHKVRKGHEPFSDWFIIVPHLIVIAVSAVMTQYVTYYLFSVGSARAVCAAITLFYIFLLALRGAIRSRQPMHFLTAGLMLVFVNLTARHYNRLPIDSFSVRNMIAFFVMTAVLSALAVRMFRKEPGKRLLQITH